jgi:hypothetical protein
MKKTIRKTKNNKKEEEFLENSPAELHNLLKKILLIDKRYWISQENDGDGVCLRVQKGREMFDELRVHSPESAKSYLVSAYKSILRNGKGGIMEISLIDSNWAGAFVGSVELF